eukprot:767916-Hanusia_phi.AAC.1
MSLLTNRDGIHSSHPPTLQLLWSTPSHHSSSSLPLLTSHLAAAIDRLPSPAPLVTSLEQNHITNKTLLVAYFYSTSVPLVSTCPEVTTVPGLGTAARPGTGPGHRHRARSRAPCGSRRPRCRPNRVTGSELIGSRRAS